MENLVGPPFFSQFDGAAYQVAVVFVQFFFKVIKERKSVGHGAGKAADDLAMIEAANFLSRPFHDDGIAHGDLAVAGDSRLAIALNGADRRGVKFCSHSVRHESCPPSFVQFHRAPAVLRGRFFLFSSCVS